MDLFVAFKNNFPDNAIALISDGADVNAVDDNNYSYTPLHYACENDWKDVVGLLLSKCANIDTVEENNMYTPLLLAVDKSNEEIAELLIDRGANTDYIGWVSRYRYFLLIHNRFYLNIMLI